MQYMSELESLKLFLSIYIDRTFNGFLLCSISTTGTNGPPPAHTCYRWNGINNYHGMDQIPNHTCVIDDLENTHHEVHKKNRK